MQPSKELSSPFSWKSEQENPQRALLVSKLASKILLVVIMVSAFFMLSSSVTLATTPGSYLNGLVYCTGTQCNQYKAAQTHCTDSFRMLQDNPVYYGTTQVGSLRWWYSDTCNTYWSQIFSTNCTNISQFEADVYIRGQSLAAAADFGLEGGCSLSGRMFYDPGEALEPGGSIYFTDGRWAHY